MSSDYTGTSIGFIGGGNMAQAIIRGLLNAGHPAKKIYVADPAPGPQEIVAAIDAAITLTTDNTLLAESCDVLVLAVKPQIMAAVAEPLKEADKLANQIVVSVAAGVTLESMQSWFGTDAALIRVMPNQPALIGEGMSGLCANPNVSDTGKKLATYVMEATGKVLWFDDEQLIDAVTAISGSGPAYFYLVMEIMQQVAEEFGFDPETARTLCTQTALGAGRVAAISAEDLTTLRERVTSPGGTTAAALQKLEESGIRDMFRTALQAARDRSVELGQG
jgi:pyrroline-5-carboxylate reductase